MKNTFKRNLLIGFSLSILLLITSSVASYTSIRNLLDSSHLVNHTHAVLIELENSISILKDAETGQRGYLLTGDQKFLTPYYGAYDKALQSVNTVEKLTADNPAQQEDAEQLKTVISNRLKRLREVIEQKDKYGSLDTSELEKGREYMNEARQIINNMQDREQQLLASHNNKFYRYSEYTPVLIFVTAILSILVTLAFFIRTNHDLKKRMELQKELQKKDEETTQRINLIQDIAGKIAKGDYKTRLTDEAKDGLGHLSAALNEMAVSLDRSFTLLSDKEWLQAGIAGLNEKMLGEKDVAALSYSIIELVAQYTNSQVGALYLLKNEKLLKLKSSYALIKSGGKEYISVGEGLVGQCALSGKEIVLEDIGEEHIHISYAAGNIKPKAILVIPFYYEKKVKGVIELGALHSFTPNEMEFLRSASYNIGIAIATAQNRQQLQELLEQTKAQSEELQTQHSELEHINAELEAQAQKLQASEEELKVQQEELQQTNQELEERSRMLEERNHLIIERNIEVRKKAEELEASTKYKSEFLANMSHELRTPLNSILLLSRLMSENHEKNLSPDQVEYAHVIQSSGKGLLSLIDEILDLSKIEAGKMQLEYSTVSLSEITDDLKVLFQPVANERNLRFDIITESSAPALVETDKQRLGQILKNLLSNAFKFTPKGTVTLHIDKAEGKIAFTVKDTGIGIAKEKQQLIFEAFQQADGSTRRKFGGTGLGLSISRELAKLLGGEIRIASQPDIGSEFALLLPFTMPGVHKEENEEVNNTLLSYYEKEELPVEQNTERDSRYTAPHIPGNIPDDRDTVTEKDNVLLIIEDDTAFAKSLLDFTRSKGYKGIVAVRGDEGLALARQYKPMGILLDIQLPVKNGWEVMQDLKNDPQTKPVPVHIMSSLEVKKESLLKGAVDFINKPVAFEQLEDIFKKLDYVLTKNPKKVLIVEENSKHAQALAYFLETYNVASEIKTSIRESMEALKKHDVDCVILDMGIPDQKAYDTLEEVKKNKELENIPIIVFTGKSLSVAEESRIKQYADSIVVKTAHSYQRIMDEVSLFLHLMEETKKPENNKGRYKKLGALNDVLNNKTVLVADDDVRNIFSLTKTLENLKMQVITAIDGKDALRQLNEHDAIDVVLMDMMMPEMDGYDTTAAIRKNPKWKHLPVIAVTAKAMTGDREKCIQAGASDYITKPVDIDQLLSLLRVWLYDKM